jgi:hypothetical protein
MGSLPTFVISSTLEDPLDWPDAKVVSGDPIDIVARLKEKSDVPLRSHGSLILNRALMTAGRVDRVQLTLYPVIAGRTAWSTTRHGAFASFHTPGMPLVISPSLMSATRARRAAYCHRGSPVGVLSRSPDSSRSPSMISSSRKSSSASSSPSASSSTARMWGLSSSGDVHRRFTGLVTGPGARDLAGARFLAFGDDWTATLGAGG